VTLVKICGVTRPEDAAAAVVAGADWLGLNFWPGSKRYLQPERAGEVVAAARGERADVGLVAVAVDPDLDELAALCDALALDRVQLHGDVAAGLVRFGARALAAVALGSDADVARVASAPTDVVLVDTPTPGYGGSGRTFDWALAEAAVATGKPVLLAGGLTPDNVAAAVARVRPFGVDVASGVESSPGVKDATLMRRFVAAAKGLP
jgi:phosphoribosylanthranilate isomerase